METSSEDTIHTLFQARVRQSPNNIAVVYENTSLTYKELNEEANRLAAYLRQNYEIKPDTLVGLCLERSQLVIIAILAILKAGGAYIPLDPNHPDERIRYILEDSKARVLLTNTIYQKRLENIFISSFPEIININSNAFILSIDDENLQSKLLNFSSDNFETQATKNNLIYVMYTSGTTATPKGVMIEHKGVVNAILSEQYYLSLHKALEEKGSFGFFNNYAFDGSVPGIFLPLILGYEVHVSNEFLKENLQEFIRKNKISITTVTSKILSLLGDDFTFLKCVMIGGEKPDAVLIRKLLNAGVKIFQEYGLTECSIISTYKELDSKTLMSNIGRPIINTTVFVLDEDLLEVSTGEIGELYIGGVGLARGYINLSEETQKKFIDNPFQTEEEKKLNNNSRLYKTGDRVRWSDGDLEYIGRADHQVKIRGYRIELGEIETLLLRFPGVKHAVAIQSSEITIGSSKEYLIAYYGSEFKLDNTLIMDYLRSQLPGYMLPNYLIYLNELPLTRNGKLNRTALPAPQFDKPANYVAPGNELEVKLCEVWSESLNLPQGKIGVLDDFLGLGGDSIIAIQIVSKIRQKLSISITVKDILNCKTIKQLYDIIQSKKLDVPNQAFFQTEQGILTGDVELLPVQQWFFANNFKACHHWNQSFLVKVSNLDLAKLQGCVGLLCEYHDSLRLRYKKINGDYLQYYGSSRASKEKIQYLNVKNISDKVKNSDFDNKLHEIFTNWQSDFNLEHGPMCKFGYIDGYEDGSARIYLAVHHLLIDTVSWRILAEDLRNIYYGKKLPKKGSSYRQWIDAINEYGKAHENEKNYWHKIISDYEIKNSKFISLIDNENIQHQINVNLSQIKTKQLLRKSNQAYHTDINDILLTALNYALYLTTESRVHHIVLEGHGREEINKQLDITRTVGWFTTIYPVRLEISDNYTASIKMIKEILRQVPNKGIGYGILMGYGIHYLPKISFNYLGQFDKNSEDIWNIIDEDSGEYSHSDNYDDNIINIRCWIIKDKLKFTIFSKLKKQITLEFSENLRRELENIIDHTIRQNRSYLTPSDIGNIINQRTLDKLQEGKEIDNAYLANSLQQGFIYHGLRQGETDDAYRVQSIWEYKNRLNIDCLKLAWVYAQNKFGCLRLRLVGGEELIQVIDKEGYLDWKYADHRHYDASSQKIQINALKDKDRLEVYKLEEGNLFRVTLVQQETDQFICIFSYHHAILDGWSIAILLNFIHTTYLKLLKNQKFVIGIDRSYELAQKYIQENSELHKDYWNDYIRKIEDVTNLNGLLLSHAKYMGLKLQGYRRILNLQEQFLVIDKELFQGLKKIKQEENVTFNTILQFVWHKVLSVYGTGAQTVIGTTVSGRTLPIDNIENSVGLYINTLPLMIEHAGQVDLTIIQAMQEIQSCINDFENKSYINLAALQKKGEHLFDSLFIYENYPNYSSDIIQQELKIHFKENVETQDYPLAVNVYENNDQILFRVRFAGELLDAEIIRYVLSSVKNLLEQVVQDPRQQVGSLNYLNDHDTQKILYKWNDTDKDFNNKKTVIDLFSEQTMRTPDNTAVIYDEIKLSYSELNYKANQLAHYLKEFGVDRETIVAIALPRSVEMIIAILAIFKAGGAYLPLDANYPVDRLQFMLDDAAVSIILTNKNMRNIIPAGFAIVIAIDEEWESINQYSSEDPVPISALDNLAYVMYTSGTTGTPKGVMIEHKGLVNLNFDLVTRYQLENGNAEVILQFANYVFDASVEQILLSLLNGYTLLLIPNNLWLDKNKFYSYLKTNKVTHIHATPIFLEQHDFSELTSLKRIIFGGDLLTKICLDSLNINSLGKKVIIINEYGPTETTITSIVNIIEGNDLAIGQPISNTKVYVLDKQLIPLPIGAIGELYIGGVGLARGYLNQGWLTKTHFIANLFQTEKEEKNAKNKYIYKTGDLVRWLPSGKLEYIGRNDTQVKLRGFRIELKEIETSISFYAGIEQCIVLLRNEVTTSGISSDREYLIAYYVSDVALEENDLLNYLKVKLPEYMIPAKFLRIDKIPLTHNGKLDKKALPLPSLTTQNVYVSPRNEIERKLCQIWAELLDIVENELSIRDNFFKLGGNSILAIRLASKINTDLGVNISVTTIFTQNTIEKLAYSLEHHVETNIIIDKSNCIKTSEQVLSFAQERLWFIDQYEQGTNAYNILMVFKISESVGLNFLEQSIRNIVRRHEILRTVIHKDEEGNIYQQVKDDKEYPVEIINTTVNDKLELEEALHKLSYYVFDLYSEYPIKVYFYKISNFITDNFESVICFVIHHIAFDGWSSEVFLRELTESYDFQLRQLNQGSLELNLPELTIQYKDFAIWQRNYLTGERLEDQLNYWRKKLEGYQTLHLPTKNRPPRINYEGANIDFNLNVETSNALRVLAKELKVSLYTVLLSAYALLLRTYSYQNDIIFGTPTANRHYNQIENLIGFFVNTLPMRVKIDPSESIRLFIEKTGEEIVSAQLHQDLPFEKLVEGLFVPKDPSRHPIFQTFFSLQNFQSNSALNGQLQEYCTEYNLYKIAKFDLSAFVEDIQPCLAGSFNYAVSIFTEATIHRLIETYILILTQLASLVKRVELRDSKIKDLNYLDLKMYKQIINSGNENTNELKGAMIINELFSKQAESTPDDIAIVYEENSLTYKELNEKSNRLAHYLIETKGVKLGSVVALCLERNLDMMVAILASLKTGAAYVPIDPNYPLDRVKFILEDTNAGVVLTNDIHKKKLETIVSAEVFKKVDALHAKVSKSITILVIDNQNLFNKLLTLPVHKPTTALTENSLAYIIYTSGTTGNPKGVMVEHQSVMNTILALSSVYDFSKGKKSTAFTSYIFDVSVSEIFVPLLRGATLYLLSEKVKADPVLLSQYVISNNINYLYLPPVVLANLPRIEYKSLQAVLYAGEPCDLETGVYWSNYCSLYNYYGPTEATIYACGKQVINGDVNLIGTPISNVKCYVLNEDLGPLPIEAIGELYIGGAGVARGYLNRSLETEEKFIPNPYQTEEEKKNDKNSRLYKTGDLVRCLEDGNLEYLGRKDSQVKIHGYRIELGEVEAAILASNQYIKQSLVVLRESPNTENVDITDKCLIAYYISEFLLDQNDIFDKLRRILPAYMLPVSLVHLTEFPLTISGKIDRNALPAPVLAPSKNFRSPSNKLESMLCKIWAEVLTISEATFSVEDDFFSLGGNSILAIRLVNKINKQFNCVVQISTLFENSNVEKMAEYVKLLNINAEILSVEEWAF